MLAFQIVLFIESILLLHPTNSIEQSQPSLTILIKIIYKLLYLFDNQAKTNK